MDLRNLCVSKPICMSSLAGKKTRVAPSLEGDETSKEHPSKVTERERERESTL